jgi:DNA-binding transcriptional LysR family regulator
MLASIPHGGSAARAIVNPELGTALITRDHDQVIAAFREAVGIGGAYARRGARDGVVRTQTVSDVGVMLGACLAGAGIAQVMALGVRDLLDQGQLIELFPDWPDETFPLCAVHPSRHHPPAKVRAFIDFCVETIR